MTNEQWLVYLWSIYPSGGYQVFYAILLIAYLFFIIFALISHSDTSDRYRTDTVWYKMGKWKIIISSVLLVLIFLSNLIHGAHQSEPEKTITTFLSCSVAVFFASSKLVCHSCETAKLEIANANNRSNFLISFKFISNVTNI